MKIVVISPVELSYNQLKSDARIHLIFKALNLKEYQTEVLQTSLISKTNFEGIFEDIHYSNVVKIKRNNFFLIRQFQKIYSISKLLFFFILGIYKYDVLVVYPSLDFRIFAMIISKLKGKKVVLEINEYPYVASKLAFFSRIKRALQFRLFWNFFDGFIVISEELKKLVAQYKKSKAVIIKIPILVRPQNDTIEKKLVAQKNKYIFHAGSMLENKDGILGIIEAFGIAIKGYSESIDLIFTGNVVNSDVSNQINVLMIKYQLTERVKFLGFITPELLNQYYSNASFSIINKKATIQNKYCFATKIANCLSVSLPIITTDFGEAKHYLQNNVSAFIVQSDNLDELADCIKKVLDLDTTTLKKIGENGKMVFDTFFNYKLYGTDLKDFLTEI